MSVLIYADADQGKISKSAVEAVNYGAQLAKKLGQSVIALTIGDVDNDEASKLSNAGADQVLVAKSIGHFDPLAIAKAAKAAAEQSKSALIVFSHDNNGKSIAPILSAKLKAGLVAGVSSFPDSGESFSIQKAVFSGKAFATYSVKTDTRILTLLPNSIQMEDLKKELNIQDLNGDFSSAGYAIMETKVKSADGIPLPEAELVVSAGRGLKGPENWGMIEELATELGAATACSRPVADDHWRPHHEHVGQTGVAIRPNLYIAIGISGAIQHLAGVNGSKVIVVINKDAEAPFFKAADYGIVGDAFEVVPKLIEAVKEFKASMN